MSMQTVGEGRDGLRWYLWPRKCMVAGGSWAHKTTSNVTSFLQRHLVVVLPRALPASRDVKAFFPPPHKCSPGIPYSVVLGIPTLSDVILHLLMPLPETVVNLVWNVVELQFSNELKINGLLHQSEFRILDLGLASNESNLLERS